MTEEVKVEQTEAERIIEIVKTMDEETLARVEIYLQGVKAGLKFRDKKKAVESA